MRLTKKELRALRLFRDQYAHAFSRVHGKTIHALERKKLLGGGRRLTAAGREALAPASIPNIFDDLFPTKKET
jgi:hypothetical protein